jgi:hypothetical protein
MGRRAAFALTVSLASATAMAHPRDRLAVETTGHHATWQPMQDTFESELTRFASTDDDHAQRAEVRATYALAGAPSTGVRVAAFGAQVLHGDWSSTAATSSTQRVGASLEASHELATWLVVEGSVSCVQARFDADAIAAGATALSPRVISSVGAKAVRGESFVAFRARGLTAHADSDDGLVESESRALLDLEAGAQRGAWGFTVTVENLLDSGWRDGPRGDLAALGSGTPLTAKAAVSFAY